MAAVIGVAASGTFASGLIVGVLVGLLVGPLIRSWLVWHEYSKASEEAADVDLDVHGSRPGPEANVL